MKIKHIRKFNVRKVSADNESYEKIFPHFYLISSIFIDLN